MKVGSKPRNFGSPAKEYESKYERNDKWPAPVYKDAWDKFITEYIERVDASVDYDFKDLPKKAKHEEDV